MNRVMVLVSAALILAMTSGCAMMAAQKERQLSASGFQMKLADTAEKETHLTSLQQRKLFPTTMNGDVVWVYADVKGCNCMYVGSDTDYQRYQKMVVRQQEIEEQQEAAEDLDDASMQWGLWGPWYRPIY